MIEGGWVCKACWKPNRPDETVCYRCRTPRAEQKAVAAGSKVAVLDPMYDKRGRLDIEWPILARAVSWPLGFGGALGLIGGFLGFGAGSLIGESGETLLGLDIGTLVMLLAVFTMALSAARIFVARSIQRFARWAYAIAIALTALGSFPYLLGLLPSPYEAGSLSADLHRFDVILNLLMFVGAIALLVMSYIRRPVTEAPAEPPPPEPMHPVAPTGHVVFTDRSPDDRG